MLIHQGKSSDVKSLPSRCMKEISNRYIYLIAFALLWICLAAVTFAMPKAESFIAMQIPHTHEMNLLMQFFSDIADGIFILSLFIVILVFIKIRLSFILLIGFAISGIVSQTLKNTVYKGEARPIKWYEQAHLPLDIPDGLKPHSWNSFPSGHSASAACLFTFLAFRTRKSLLLIVCAIGPFLAGYSRIYLFHHFPEDVLAGLFIGLLIQLIIERLSINWFVQPNYDKALLRK